MSAESRLNLDAVKANSSLALIEYWQDRFDGFSFTSLIEPGITEAGEPDDEKATVSGELCPDAAEVFYKVAPSDEARHIVLFAALSAFAYNWSGSNDFAIFTPRFTKGKLTGNINVLPVRMNGMEGQSLKSFLPKVKTAVLNDLKHGSLSLEKIIENNNADFDSLPITGMALRGLQEPAAFDDLNPDLLFTFDCGETVKVELVFNRKKYPASFGKRLVSLFMGLLQNLMNRPGDKFEHIPFIPGEEEDLIRGEFNNTEKPYSSEETIVSYFERQVKETPDKVAIQLGEDSMTYQELNRLADRIASYLQYQKGLTAGDLVGVMLEREMNLIPCIYGILKAGGVYVPIDPKFPAGRINMIASDAQLRFIITRSEYISSELEIQSEFIDLDKQMSEVEQFPILPLTKSYDSRSVAYIIFTSGTTGRPKGAMIEHHSVINRLEWMQNQAPIGGSDVLLQKTPITFDVSVWELFWWSFYGATLTLLPPNAEKDPDEVASAISRYKVTTIHFVPSMLNLFLTTLRDTDTHHKVSSLKQVFASGEALKPAYVNLFGEVIHSRFRTRLINLYGPTEATIDVSCYECQFDNETTLVPIGRSIDNTRLFILDHLNRLAPIGMPGELVIAGVQVGRGYLNNETLTKEKFTTVNTLAGERIYRTGDVTCWMPDGNIAYIGRADHQVKVRGYRIELGEIESLLMAHDQVRDTIVIAVDKSGNDKFLAAYYVPDGNLSPNMVEEYLRSKLPSYMVPSFMVPLRHLPLTNNGKVDRKALPNPLEQKTKAYEAPKGEVEQELTAIWASLLNVEAEKIGREDSFFSLGGHSILAVRLIQSIEQKYGVLINLKEIFTYATIEKQATLITGGSLMIASGIPKAPKAPHYLASSAQERLFCIQMLDKEDVVNNMTQVYRIKGDLDKVRLTDVFRKLLERHQGLRTNFFLNGETVFQKVRKESVFTVESLATDNYKDVQEAYHNFVRPFDLENDLLIRGATYVNEDEEAFLFVDMHHIVCDGISMNILMNDFKRIYEGEATDELPLTYIDFAMWQRQSGESLQKERAYWTERLSGSIPRVELPALKERHEVDIYHGDTRTLHISGTLLDNIKQRTNEWEVSEYMLLISAYYILLSKMSGQSDIIIGTDAIGRTQAELQNVVGTFVNVLPLRLEIKQEMSFLEMLGKVKETVLEGFDNQELPYDEMLKLAGRGQNESVVDVYFSNADFFRSEAETKGLTFEPLALDKKVKTTRWELELNVEEANDILNIRFIHSTDLFDTDTINLLMNYYRNILETITYMPDLKIDEIELEGSLQSI